MGIERSTFLIDAKGQIRREWRKVRVKGHAAEVLAAARELASDAEEPAREGRAAARSCFDTNVLMHDPAAIFRFEEHDIYMPMIVLEELDAGKKGLSESARNVRQVSRFLDELMRERDQGADRPRPRAAAGRSPATTARSRRPGRLFFQTQAARGRSAGQPARARRRQRDPRRTRSRCRRSCPARASRWCRRTSTCASRPRSSACTPRTTTATRRSRTPTCSTPACTALPADFWEQHRQATSSPGRSSGRTFYRVRGAAVQRLAAEPVPLRDRQSNGIEAHRARIDGDVAVLEVDARLPQRRATASGASRRATASRTSR